MLKIIYCTIFCLFVSSEINAMNSTEMDDFASKYQTQQSPYISIEKKSPQEMLKDTISSIEKGDNDFVVLCNFLPKTKQTFPLTEKIILRSIGEKVSIAQLRVIFSWKDFENDSVLKRLSFFSETGKAYMLKRGYRPEIRPTETDEQTISEELKKPITCDFSEGSIELEIFNYIHNKIKP